MSTETTTTEGTTMYAILKTTARTKTTWKSGAMQRNGGTRWNVINVETGQRTYAIGRGTSDGGFFRKCDAEAYAADLNSRVVTA